MIGTNERNQKKKKKKKHKVISIRVEIFIAVGHKRQNFFFVLADLPSNKHNYHQNAPSVHGLLKANGYARINHH